MRIRQVWQGHRWVIEEIHVTPAKALPIGGLTARDFDLIRPVTLAWAAGRGDGPPVRGKRVQEPKWADEELEFSRGTSPSSLTVNGHRRGGSRRSTPSRPEPLTTG